SISAKRSGVGRIRGSGSHLMDGKNALWPRSHPRHPGSLPHEPRWRRRPLAQYSRQPSIPLANARSKRFGWSFAHGDKVMQIENDSEKDVYNGVIGYVDDVDPDAGETHRKLRRPGVRGDGSPPTDYCFLTPSAARLKSRILSSLVRLPGQ